MPSLGQEDSEFPPLAWGQDITTWGPPPPHTVHSQPAWRGLRFWPPGGSRSASSPPVSFLFLFSEPVVCAFPRGKEQTGARHVVGGLGSQRPDSGPQVPL